MYRTSQSKDNKWRQCKQRFLWIYVYGLRPIKKGVPLWRGSLIHAMDEAHLNGDDPWAVWEEADKEWQKLFKEEQLEFGDLPGKIEAIMDSYFEYYKNDGLKPVRIADKSAEHEFEYPLTEHILIRAKVDRVVDDKAKRRWIVDTKSGKIPTEVPMTDLQACSYVWLLPKFDLGNAVGICWNYIRDKAPVWPEVLKSGQMSRRANIDTTWSTYKAALEDAGLDPKDYSDMRKALAGKEADFFSRDFVKVSMRTAQHFIDELIISSEQAIAFLEQQGLDPSAKPGAVKLGDIDDSQFVRSIGKHCNWCDHRALCRARLMGNDVTPLLRKFKVTTDAKKTKTPARKRARRAA